MLVLSQSGKLRAPSLPACVLGFLGSRVRGGLAGYPPGIAGRNKVLQQNLRSLGVGSQKKTLLKFAFDGHGWISECFQNSGNVVVLLFSFLFIVVWLLLVFVIAVVPLFCYQPILVCHMYYPFLLLVVSVLFIIVDFAYCLEIGGVVGGLTKPYERR